MVNLPRPGLIVLIGLLCGIGLFSIINSPLIWGAIGQPRLLVPVALVMIYNRWNGIIVPEYGFMHLELIPMLVGFFTYKIATFTQAIEEAINVVGGNDAQVD